MYYITQPNCSKLVKKIISTLKQTQLWTTFDYKCEDEYILIIFVVVPSLLIIHHCCTWIKYTQKITVTGTWCVWKLSLYWTKSNGQKYYMKIYFCSKIILKSNFCLRKIWNINTEWNKTIKYRYSHLYRIFKSQSPTQQLCVLLLTNNLVSYCCNSFVT